MTPYLKVHKAFFYYSFSFPYWLKASTNFSYPIPIGQNSKSDNLISISHIIHEISKKMLNFTKYYINQNIESYYTKNFSIFNKK